MSGYALFVQFTCTIGNNIYVYSMYTKMCIIKFESGRYFVMNSAERTEDQVYGNANRIN